MKPAEKESKKKAWVIILAMRCEFVVLPYKLTYKGRGALPPFIWRAINNIQCKFDKEHRERMYNFLKWVEQKEKEQITNAN